MDEIARFNTLRKHIKIEPLRWYYHCDRLGMLVWQDMVNGGGKYDSLAISLPMIFGNAHKDSDYAYFAARRCAAGRRITANCTRPYRCSTTVPVS